MAVWLHYFCLTLNHSVKMLKWWKEKGSNLYDGTCQRWRFLRDRMQEKKLESSYIPTVKPATVATILPSHLSMINKCWILTCVSSCQLPSSWKTNNKPDYLVSSSWSHTATQPCFSMINPWINATAAASADRSVHACMCLWDWAGASSRVYFCHGPPPHLCGLVTGAAEGCVCTGRKTSVLLNRTWVWIVERWSVSHAHLTVQSGHFTSVLKNGLVSASAFFFFLLLLCWSW